jgi:hypothetical protein
MTDEIEVVTDLLTPTPKGKPTAEERWKANMSWVFEDPYCVALGRSYPEQDNDVCPVWGDRLQWKSVTVIVPADEEGDATLCLACAHGGGHDALEYLPTGTKLRDGTVITVDSVAIRSSYQAW